MRLAPLLPAVALSVCVNGPAMHGQATQNTPPRSTSAGEPLPPIFAPKAAPTSAPQKASGNRGSAPAAPTPTRRAMSREMAEKLSGVVARVPGPAIGSAPRPATTTPSSGDPTDAVQLDPYIVAEKKPRELKGRHLLTLEAQHAHAHKQSPGMTLEDVRRKEIAELETVLTAGGEKPSRDILRKVKEAQIRNNEWNNQKTGTPFREPR
jgi:hypothetical protein